ncbi:MAG: hypothetical protein AVDCRST_MAG22-1252, partial [uncultured Rubrobacteraceae bacterium]
DGFVWWRGCGWRGLFGAAGTGWRARGRGGDLGERRDPYGRGIGLGDRGGLPAARGGAHGVLHRRGDGGGGCGLWLDPALRAASGVAVPEGRPGRARGLAGARRPDAVLGLDAGYDRRRCPHADGRARRLLGRCRRGAYHARWGEGGWAAWL